MGIIEELERRRLISSIEAQGVVDEAKRRALEMIQAEKRRNEAVTKSEVYGMAYRLQRATGNLGIRSWQTFGHSDGYARTETANPLDGFRQGGNTGYVVVSQDSEAGLERYISITGNEDGSVRIGGLVLSPDQARDQVIVSYSFTLAYESAAERRYGSTSEQRRSAAKRSYVQGGGGVAHLSRGFKDTGQ